MTRMAWNLDTLRRAAAILGLAGIAAGAAAAPLQIERIEPPNWWVGMHEPAVQLMVHGAGIGAATAVETSAAGVRVQALTRVANPNYLFVDLAIAADAAPGALDLVFRRGDEAIHRRWTLEPRVRGSAQRRGFANEDVILNLVPDRFANGDPSNDDQPGFADRARRADISAGRHGGDLKGIADHLDDLAKMGYTFLWPTPLVENNQPKYSYHGYAATDTYRIDPRLGSNDDYRALVARAASHGIGMIQDIVLNHIGSGHWWLRDLPEPDWLTSGGRFTPTRHARTAISDPYAAQADRENFTAGWFGPEMPDMNQRNPRVATYQIQNTLWWIEYAGLRGVRVDTYGYSDTAFLAEWSRRVMAEYPRINLVGEEWSPNPLVVAHWLRGHVNPDGHVSAMPSMMDFPLNDALRRALAGEEGWNAGLNVIYEAMVNDLQYPQPENLVLFEGNHDMPRLFSAVGEDPGLWRIALAWVLTMPRIPQLYYGTEILLTSPTQRDDGATRQDFPGGWPGDVVNAFTGAGLSPAQREAQAFLRTLLNWRKSQPAIHHGRLVHYAPENGSYVWFRLEPAGGAAAADATGRARVMVAVNKGRAALALETSRFAAQLPAGSHGRDVITGERFDLGRPLPLPARSVRVLELQ